MIFFNVCVVVFLPADELIQLTAITWVGEFLNLAGRTMLPFASGLLNATLPCMAYEEPKRKDILLKTFVSGQ